MASDTTPARGRRTTIIVIVAAVLALAAAYVATAFFASNGMPRHTQVAGIDVGGLSEAEAKRTLDEQLAPRAEKPIEITAEDNSAKIDPADAGIVLDTQATVNRGAGFTLNPVRIYERLFDDNVIDPVITVDESKKSVIEEVGSEMSTEPVDATLAYDEDGKPKVTDSSDGTIVTADAIRETIDASWLREDPPLAVTAQKKEADITTAEAEKARTDIAEPAISDDVMVTADPGDHEDVTGGTITVSPETVSQTLEFEPKDSDLTPVFDAKRLKRLALAESPQVGQEMKNASYEIVDGKPKVVPSEKGISVDEKEFADAVLPALTSDDRTAEVTLTETDPEFSTEDAEKADVDTVIAKFATPYNSEPNRDTNLRVASKKVSGTVLLPGEQFSLNETLGKRTAANGYKPAGVISEGQMKTDFGGGVSQVSTTLFNAAFFAGLDLDEHRAHSRYISRYPEGRETTLDWTSIDLKFTNNTDKPMVLDMYLKGGEVHARVFGVKTVDVEADASSRFAFTSPSTVTESGPSCSPQSPREGWSITIYRTIKDHSTGKVVKKDDFTTVYRPVNRVQCRTGD